MKLTQRQLNASLVLILTTASFGVAFSLLENLRAGLLIGLAVVGQFSVLVLLLYGDKFKRKSRWFGSLLLSSLLAKAAIILVAIAIGIGVGLIGWAGVAILDAINNIEENRLKGGAGSPDDGVQDVAVVDPGAYRLSIDHPVTAATATVDKDADGNAPEDDQPPHLFSIPVPANAALEKSSDFQHWTTVFYNPGPSSATTYWNPDDKTGYFRLRQID